MAVYGAMSFAALEGLSLLQPVLFVPGWVYRAAGFIVITGFPLVVVLTWIFDYEGAVVRTPPATHEELDVIVQQPRRRRWPAGALALLGIVLLGSSAWYAMAPVPAAPDEGFPVVAVLPFVNRSTAAEDGFFADGLLDDVLMQLSENRAWRVVSRTSVLRFQDSGLSLSDIADSLGASVILEGAVQRAGRSVRISVQVIDAGTDQHLWASRWDSVTDPDSLLALQSQVAAHVAAALATLPLATVPAEKRRRQPS